MLLGEYFLKKEDRTGLMLLKEKSRGLKDGSTKEAVQKMVDGYIELMDMIKI